MTKKYDVVAVTGTYEKGGETKKRYQTVGAIIEGKHGPYLIMERWFNPAGLPNPEGRSNVIFNLFEPKIKEDGYAAAKQAAGGDDLSDEIPF